MNLESAGVALDRDKIVESAVSRRQERTNVQGVRSQKTGETPADIQCARRIGREKPNAVGFRVRNHELIGARAVRAIDFERINRLGEFGRLCERKTERGQVSHFGKGAAAEIAVLPQAIV